MGLGTQAKNISLVAGREIRQRTSSRGFRIATAITMVAAIGYVAIPHILATKQSNKVVGLVKPYAASIPYLFKDAAKADGIQVTLRTYHSVIAAKAAINGGSAFVAYDAKSGLIVKKLASGDSATQFAERAAAEIAKAAAISKAKLTPAQLSMLRNPKLPAIVGLNHGPSPLPAEQKAAIFESILMYVLLGQYGAWVMLGVVEEKSTQVIEVLLAAVEPTELLVGKIVGIGTVAVIHAGLVIVSLIAGLFVIGSGPTNVISGSLLITAPIWFVVGYAFYCTLFGAVGSTVSRTEDAQAASFPVAVPMLVGYISVVFTLAGNLPSSMAAVLSFIPGISPFLSPVLYSLHEISLAKMAISLAVSVLATVFLGRVAVRVYTASILRIGARVKFGDVRRAAVAKSPT